MSTLADPQQQPPQNTRDPWLDLLRAAAIVPVVCFHLVQHAPMLALVTRAWQIAAYGYVGVDLFFVLSGWLIGGLYWQERSTRGAVNLWHFWRRRWWRTVPAYAVALLLSWAAVYLTRRASFDWTYLLFVQNYRPYLPFFVVSWSLCVEEHFYLLLPLLLGLLGKWPHALFAVLTVLPTLLRAAVVDSALATTAGFYFTATHLHLDGLMLGFWLALLRRDRSLWARLQRMAPLLAAAAGAAAVLALRRAGIIGYVTSPSLLALGFAALLIACVGRRHGSGARSVRFLAEAAYSIYLTHVLGVHVARAFAQRLAPEHSNLGYFLTAPILVLALGTTFQRCVELPVMRLRERFVPRNLASAVDSNALEHRA